MSRENNWHALIAYIQAVTKGADEVYLMKYLDAS